MILSPISLARSQRCDERNKSAETQFNKKRCESLVKLFFLDNLKRLKNKREIY